MSFQWFKRSSISGLKNNSPSHDTQQPETSKSTEASTILDVLNTYCWKVILDKLDISDVMRSERVSRDWQRVVLEYLQENLDVHVDKSVLENVKQLKEVEETELACQTQTKYLEEVSSMTGIHKLALRNAWFRSNHFWQIYKNSRLVHIDFYNKDHFDQMVQKIGPLVVQLSTDCICDRSLMAIAESCPNIEYLGFYHINFVNEVSLSPRPTTTAVEIAAESLNSLKGISFHTCGQLQNFFSCMFANNKTFEELKFINSCSSCNIDLALNFWLDFKWTTLKSVTVSRLDKATGLVEWSGLQTASSNWRNLTKLHLDDNPMRIFDSLYIILENFRNLELLSLCGYEKYYPDCYHRPDIVLMGDGSISRIRRDLINRLVESIGRHSGLKHLYLARNDNVDNEWLETLAQRCKELHTLDIGSCKAVSSLGALQSLAPTLEKLSLPDNMRVTDTDLIDCIRVCHRLTFLDVSRCSGATPRLVHEAERATRHRTTRHRAPPLQLRLDETDMTTVQIMKAAGFEIEMQKRRESYPWYLPQEIQVRHKGLTLHWSNKAPEAHLPLRGPLAAEYRYDRVLRQDYRL